MLLAVFTIIISIPRGLGAQHNAFQLAHNHSGDIETRNGLDTLEAGRRVYVEHHGSAVRAEDIDPGKRQAEIAEFANKADDCLKG